MTDTNNSSKSTDELQADYKATLANTRYLLDNDTFEQLERYAASYEALHTIIEPFESDSPMSAISLLLDQINGNFFDFIETITTNSIQLK